jgi:hypothetical protein
LTDNCFASKTSGVAPARAGRARGGRRSPSPGGAAAAA